MVVCSAIIGAMYCSLGDFHAKGSNLHPIEENAYRDVRRIFGGALLLHDYI
jgi:hypothetical protein